GEFPDSTELTDSGESTEPTEFRGDGDATGSGRSAAAQQPGEKSIPSCLLTRAAYLDVLPVAWDLASPVLAEWVPTASLPTHTPQALAPHQLATALGELDDHLFALALALVRQVYLRAAAVLEVAPPGDIFYLPLVELRQALADKLDVREALRVQKNMHQQLPKQAPRLLYQGHPMAKPGHRPLEGMGLGPGVGGKLAVRHSLAETLADPPEPGTILVLPSLTAQAAVVLHTQGIRAVCCEYGGWMSHAAIMARELGISALIGCQGCTDLANGTPVWMDTSGGRLVVEGRVPGA
ncbi:MAG: PEP-utilizing enzyme, partial [Nannocystaceae bacterium]